MLVDIETGTLIPEAEIAWDVMRAHMHHSDRRGFVNDEAKREDESDLDKRTARRRAAAPQRCV
jgi:hypothetical protein